jgi:Spy/CpxP family protein refolding chaperone
MRFRTLAAVLGVGLLIAGAATAQPPGGAPGGPGGPGGGLGGMIGRSKQLQDELKVDKDQLEKLNAALAKVREELRGETDKLRNRDTPADEREKIAKKVSEANAKALASALTPEQVKRLRQIENQQAGIGMYSKEDVQTALKLTDDQQEKIKEINDELQKELRQLSSGSPGGRRGADPQAAKQRESLQKEAMARVQKFLDASQKAALKDLTGEPFALSQEGFGPGGGPGGGGPGGPGGGRGGPGGFGAPSQPGQVMSSFVQDALKLTPEQKQRMEQLQREVDSQIATILTDEQKKQLKEMQQAGGRGGPGGGRGRGGPGGPGGDGGKPPQRP